MKVKPSNEPGKVVLEAADQDAALLARGACPSIRLEKMLVPVDFSECSRKALQYGVALARQFGASVSLIHVVGLNYGGEFGAIDIAAIETEMAASSTAQLKTMLEKEVPGDLRADAIVRIGPPATTIVDSAREHGTDLIIISTHGYRGLKHFLLGSTTENVVRLAPCPVLVVREHEHEFVTN